MSCEGAKAEGLTGARVARRLLTILLALNTAGIVCLAAATRTREPAAAGGGEYAFGWSSALEMLGFTLMLPGIFFAAPVLVGGHALRWGADASRAAWYACGCVLNLLLAWRLGAACGRRAGEN